MTEVVEGASWLLHDSKQRIKKVFDDAKKYVDKYFSESKDNAMSNGVNESKSSTDMKFDILSYDIKSVRKEARQAAAVGLAVSNLRYFDELGSLSVSFGSGTWRGQSAFALGAGIHLKTEKSALISLPRVLVVIGA
ncbi:MULTISPECIES: YadA-like family protein [unclassified Bartonella]|uniref:YadA-like family protein n=1 Tax=unclassified Bartonella TaxID=2645622 RepID=UPI0035D07059